MSNQWKLVPVEPTEDMVIHGFESAPNECFTDYKVWDAYQEMSGCQQAAFRAKLCWAAMLAAAPVPQQADLDRVILQPAPVAVVPELTSELRWILGQMCFQHIHTAQALRLMGHEIARKAEDEQAVTIYWMLGHYLKDPANWRQNATAELKASAPAA